MYHYTQDSVFVRSKSIGEFKDTLDVGFYKLAHHPMLGFFFEKANFPDIPDIIYDNLEDKAHKILKTFNDRKGNTGVLLSGLKGTGKTLLAKQISILSGLPVISISQPYSNDDFISFINSIDQDCVIMIDEFEKVYSSEFDDQHEDEFKAQEKLLSLLDGMSNNRKLWIITANQKHKISSYMKDRPGRILYHLEFDSLSPNFVDEFCQENLNNYESKIRDINLYYLFAGRSFSFDVLKSLIEEINRYPDTPTFEVIRDLNIPRIYPQVGVDVKIKVNDMEYEDPVQLSDMQQDKLLLTLSNRFSTATNREFDRMYIRYSDCLQFDVKGPETIHMYVKGSRFTQLRDSRLAKVDEFNPRSKFPIIDFCELLNIQDDDTVLIECTTKKYVNREDLENIKVLA